MSILGLITILVVILALGGAASMLTGSANSGPTGEDTKLPR